MIRIIPLLAVLLVLPINTAFARIDILPQKIVMEPRERSSEITILNLFDQPSLYRISFLNYRQNPDGTYTELDHPLSEHFNPEEIVRISPRQFTIESSGRQKIRLSVRKPQALPDGEYRFHVLALRREAPDAETTQDEPGVSAKIKMNVGVSIPVVVRHGETQVTAQINEMRFIPSAQSEGQRNELFVSASRQGNASAIGELSIYNGDERIGHISNFNIFTEINERHIAIPLSIDPRGQGTLRIIYQTEDGEVFDEKTFQP